MNLDTHLQAFATVDGHNATFTAPDGRREPISAGAGQDIRQMIVHRATEEARRAGTPVELATTGDRGSHRLLIAIDGGLASVPDDPTPPSQPALDDPSHQENLAEARMQRSRSSEEDTEPVTRTSFIAPPREGLPQRTGWRRRFAAFGLSSAPSLAQTRRAEQVHSVSQQWAGCRTAAVVNGKGGVGKTMTTAMLAAVFARYGGGNVLAWDNNDTRGTLGWRTEQGLYDATVCDLLPAAPALLAPSASVSDIARFVHHQAADRYDVLRSNPQLLAAHQRILKAEFDVLMQVAARYYRLVFFDSGNDESADRWLRMVDSSYQLVIPTLAAPESAESAALLLDALRARDERSAALANNAIVVVTQAEPTNRAAVDRITDGFAGQVRTLERVPFDPALKSGPLRFDHLRPATRDAWLRVAAAVAHGF